MRTTLDLPDALFRQVKARAAVTGTTIKSLITRYIETGLRQPEKPRMPGKRSRLPVIKRRGKTSIPNVTSKLQAHLEEGEDLGKLGRSFGR
jgi:hypothetical protein